MVGFEFRRVTRSTRLVEFEMLLSLASCFGNVSPKPRLAYAAKENGKIVGSETCIEFRVYQLDRKDIRGVWIDKSQVSLSMKIVTFRSRVSQLTGDFHYLPMPGSESVKLRDMGVRLVTNAELVAVRLIPIRFNAIARLMVDLMASYLLNSLWEQTQSARVICVKAMGIKTLT